MRDDMSLCKTSSGAEVSNLLEKYGSGQGVAWNIGFEEEDITNQF